MQAVSKLNDVVNGLANHCKRLVECADGSIVITNQEAGTDLNTDAERCLESMQESVEDQTLPRVFTEKFKSDLLAPVYKKCLPPLSTDKRARDALCCAVLPGLASLRRTLRQQLAEMNDDTVSTDDLKTFFDNHLCDNPLCVKDAFKADPKPLPRLNVSHPEWFYFPRAPEYTARAAAYIKLFLKDPCSRRCALCDTFFKITEGQDPVDLYGLPEQFKINDSICSLYGRYTLDQPLAGLKIKTSGGSDFVVTWADKIYY